MVVLMIGLIGVVALLVLSRISSYVVRFTSVVTLLLCLVIAQVVLAQDASPSPDLKEQLLTLLATILKTALPTLIVVYAPYLTKGLQWLTGSIPKPLQPVISILIGGLINVVSAAELGTGADLDTSAAVGGVGGLMGHTLLQSKRIEHPSEKTPSDEMQVRR